MIFLYHYLLLSYNKLQQQIKSIAQCLYFFIKKIHQGFIQALMLTSVFHQGLSFMVVGLQYIIDSPQEISSPLQLQVISFKPIFLAHRDSVSCMYESHLDHNVKVRWIVNFQNARRNKNIEKINRTNLKRPPNSQDYVGPCSWVSI